MKILVVDDVPMYVELLREPLAGAGYEPVVATSAAEARQALARHEPRLVFLDLHMPGEPGDVLCREMTAAGGANAPPVVMMGVGGRDDDRRRCEQAGCRAFLAKPVRPAVLLETAARFLKVGERQPRVPLRVPVLCLGLGLRRVVQAANLSAGGLFVTTSRPLPAGTRLVLEFRLPLDTTETPLRLSGEVCWSVEGALARAGIEPGMGVRFEAVDPAAQAAIDRFIRRSLAAARVAATRLGAPGPRSTP